MIISASRRTDIAAFYAPWMINRLRAGYCTVPNPFNRKQVSRISIRPDEIDVIVFWTRNPRPLFPFLDEMNALQLRYYFQYTIMGNIREIDPKSPSVETAVKTFKELTERLGDPRRVIWRYDPVVFTTDATPEKQLQRFERLAHDLRGYTCRCVVSVVDIYGKAAKRLAKIGVGEDASSPTPDQLQSFFGSVKLIGDACGMDVFSCAEEIDLARYAIPAGKCVDDRLIKAVFDVDVSHRKDASQRAACGCVESKDIGMYDTCLYGCQYCYATRSFELARTNYAEHDEQSPSLIGHYDVPEGLERASVQSSMRCRRTALRRMISKASPTANHRYTPTPIPRTASRHHPANESLPSRTRLLHRSSIRLPCPLSNPFPIRK